MKKLFRHYSSDDEIINEWVEEDTPKYREEIIEDIGYDNCFGKKEYIIGEGNTVTYECYGEETTGGYITVLTYEKALEELQLTYNKSMKDLKDLFR